MKINLKFTFVIIAFCLVFLFALAPITDPDFWWHLRSGQLIAETGKITRVDLFSITALGDEWITQEWLSDLMIYKLYEIWKPGLLQLVFPLIITGAFLFSYLRCPKESKSFIAGLVMLLGALTSASIMGVRPYMMTVLLTSVYLFLLDKYTETAKLKYLIPLPVLMALWVNLHAGYQVGLGIILIYLAGDLIELITKKEKINRVNQKPILFLVGTFAASFAASLLNPNGLKLLTYPLETLGDPAQQENIIEWMSPNFHQAGWIPLAAMIMMLIGLGMVNKKRLHSTRVLLSVVFSFAALYSMRYVILFAIVIIPILAEMITNLINPNEKQEEISNRKNNWIPILIGILMTVLIYASFLKVIEKQALVEEQTLPKGAADWIIKNKPEGDIFNAYTWGGYLIWRLYPKHLVYIDGRAEIFDDKVITNYQEIYSTQLGWEILLEEQPVDMVLVEVNSKLAQGLRESQRWELIFEDEVSAVFERE